MFQWLCSFLTFWELLHSTSVLACDFKTYLHINLIYYDLLLGWLLQVLFTQAYGIFARQDSETNRDGDSYIWANILFVPQASVGYFSSRKKHISVQIVSNSSQHKITNLTLYTTVTFICKMIWIQCIRTLFEVGKYIFVIFKCKF